MTESGKNPWLDVFTPINQPNIEKPWLELRCDRNEKLFLEQFISSIGNVPTLDEEDHGLVFRGQKNEEWTLKPTLVRLWEETYVETKEKKNVVREALIKEYDSIQYFQKRACSLESFFRNLDRKLTRETYPDWLASMQHYSAPTRLLDWTTSFYVALYFAVEDDGMDGAVWILNKSPITKYMDKRIDDLKLKEEHIDGALSGHDEYVSFGMTVEPIVEVVSNQTKTDRMIAQGSIFTLSYKLFYDHAQVASPFVGSKDLVLFKLVIPSALKKTIRLHLSKMNIFAETLFPGIESIGKTISEKIKLFQEAYEI